MRLKKPQVVQLLLWESVAEAWQRVEEQKLSRQAPHLGCAYRLCHPNVVPM